MNGSKRMKNVVSSVGKMRNLSGLLAIAMVLTLFGCQPKDNQELKRASSGNADTAQQQAEEKSAEDAEKIKKAIEDIKKPSGDTKIVDEPETWADAKPVAPAVEKSIGQKIDDAFAEMPPAMVQVNMEISDRGSMLKSRPTMKIQDKDMYSIQYALPETKGAINMITADGTERALFEDGKLKSLPAIGQSRTRSKMNRKDIEDFAKAMPREGFSYFAYGDRPWSALVAGLQDPKNGFDVKIEEMNAKPIGESRPFYRVIADSKQGSDLKIEFVVDTKRNVPVVFRTNFKYPDGQERMMVWRADWAFGGTHAKDDFKIPKEPKKS